MNTFYMSESERAYYAYLDAVMKKCSVNPALTIEACEREILHDATVEKLRGNGDVIYSRDGVMWRMVTALQDSTMEVNNLVGKVNTQKAQIQMLEANLHLMASLVENLYNTIPRVVSTTPYPTPPMDLYAVQNAISSVRNVLPR